MMRILAVCTGNTCRSPMAAALLARRVAGIPELTTQIEVRSAGTGAIEGDPATGEAIRTMDARGIDIRAHRATRADQALLEWANLVLGMTRSHRDACIDAGAAQSKATTIGEFARSNEEVTDPIGRGSSAYEDCAAQLDRLVAYVADRLLKEQLRGGLSTGTID